MKKLITVLLILALILPAAALADDPLDFYAGYAHVEMVESEKDAPFMSIIKFDENGKCYYSEQQFFPDRPGTANAMIGTWESVDEETILIKIGRTNASITFHILKNGDLINTDTMQIYNRVNAIWVSR